MIVIKKLHENCENSQISHFSQCKFLIPLFAIPVYRRVPIPYQIASTR